MHTTNKVRTWYAKITQAFTRRQHRQKQFLKHFRNSANKTLQNLERIHNLISHIVKHLVSSRNYHCCQTATLLLDAFVVYLDLFEQTICLLSIVGVETCSPIWMRSASETSRWRYIIQDSKSFEITNEILFFFEK